MSDVAEMVAWVRVQVEADKVAAKRASAIAPRWVDAGSLLLGLTEEPNIYDLDFAEATNYRYDDALAHAARHDPQDVIADCDAKLAILDEHTPEGDTCRTCTVEDREVLWDGEEETVQWVHRPTTYPCRTVRLLAQGYRHRDGGREEWAT